jgi:hypothetical protein
MFPRGRTCVTIFCAGLGALFITSVARAQPNFLIPLPTESANLAIRLNNSGQLLFVNGLYTGATFTPFPAGFLGQALNESGVIAGTTASATHLALYSAGTVTDLGPFPALSGAALGINASGEIVGYTLGGYEQPFIYSGGAIQPVNLTIPNGSNAEAVDINAIAGRS